MKDDFLAACKTGDLSLLKNMLKELPRETINGDDGEIWEDEAPGFITGAPQSRPLGLAASMGFTEVVSELLKAGASIDAQDWRGETALHKAVQAKQIECAKALISKGARLNINACDGNELSTALINESPLKTLFFKISQN